VNVKGTVIVALPVVHVFVSVSPLHEVKLGGVIASTLAVSVKFVVPEDGMVALPVPPVTSRFKETGSFEKHAQLKFSATSRLIVNWSLQPSVKVPLVGLYLAFPLVATVNLPVPGMVSVTHPNGFGPPGVTPLTENPLLFETVTVTPVEGAVAPSGPHGLRTQIVVEHDVLQPQQPGEFLVNAI
jgi:hypothetical protein